MQKLKIEMIHDPVCSWCHIGYHNLKMALLDLNQERDVEFSYIPYVLNPDLDENGIRIEDFFMKLKGWSQVQLHNYRESLLATCADVGVVIDFNKRTHYYNTQKAHQLILAAEQIGLQRNMHERLLQAYHVEGLNISNNQVLISLAIDVGLTESTTIEAIHPQNTGVFELKKQRTAYFPVTSIPAWIFNNDKFVPGSNSTKFFKDYVREKFLTSA